MRGTNATLRDQNPCDMNGQTAQADSQSDRSECRMKKRSSRRLYLRASLRAEDAQACTQGC